ncbi:MAG: carboxypeptidase-like regulatory domain-containing protein [bacterium]|nr:carboxypeptidase-like regulatory domain-containing protein [Candidatus Margulisiibacteriota bacterium]
MRLKVVISLLLCGIVFFACFLTIFGCAQVASEIGRITGTILAADGVTAIVGATVYNKADSSKSTTTNGSGQFTLEGDWIVAGTYTLVANKGSFQLEFSATVEANSSTTALDPRLVSPLDPRASIPDLGVVEGSFDQIQDIISALGYSFVTLEATDFDNYSYLSTFEAIFINCGDSVTLTSSRNTNLQNFVEVAGGSLYASDYAASHIEAIWPTAITWYGGSVSAAKVGNSQTLEATIQDSILRTVLGKSTAEVYYNLSEWVVISSEGTGTTVLLKGSPNVATVFSVGFASLRSSDLSVSAIAGTLEAVPLAVKFQPGGTTMGTVIYTTFHNEAQEEEVTADVRKILQDFIFSL